MRLEDQVKKTYNELLLIASGMFFFMRLGSLRKIPQL